MRCCSARKKRDTMTATELITLTALSLSAVSLVQIVRLKREVDFLLIGRQLHINQVEELESKLAALERAAARMPSGTDQP